MWLVIVLFILILCVGVAENIRIRRLSDKVPVRILVNGTRGKSSVTRMLVAALNGCGIRTCGKTTGSAARFIFPDLSEESVLRKNSIRMVHEHMMMFEKAVSNGCQAIVCECMAIREENQKVVGSRLVRPTVTIITNARVDHVDQMGDTVAETASVLCRSIGPSTDVYTADPSVKECLVDSSVKVHLAGPLSALGKTVLNGFSFPVHEENLSLVLAVCSDLGLGESKVLESVVNAVPDKGMTSVMEVRGHVVVNGFAANDAESSGRLFDGLDMSDVTVVYANRADREFRLPCFRSLLQSLQVKDIVVTGDNAAKCRRYFSRIPGAEVRIADMKDMEDMDAFIDSCRKNIICLGNIKGAGEKMLEVLADAV